MPENFCLVVRPWIARAESPADSKFFAVSIRFSSLKNPRRILAVTGIFTVLARVSMSFTAFSGVFRIAEPELDFRILGLGQPKFRSTKSAPKFSTTFAASVKAESSEPKSWIPKYFFSDL